MIGYKAWGALPGRRPSKQDIIVCCLDYHSLPQACCVPRPLSGTIQRLTLS